ncbi:MAG: hypothetical protein ABIY51_10400 [Ferruginibacter sp.]
MGIVQKGSLLSCVRGRVGDLIVKHYKDKIVVTQAPNFGPDKPTKLQKLYRSEFSKAVAYAQAITRNREKKKAYAKKAKNGQRVYNYAIQEYYRNQKKK